MLLCLPNWTSFFIGSGRRVRVLDRIERVIEPFRNSCRAALVAASSLLVLAAPVSFAHGQAIPSAPQPQTQPAQSQPQTQIPPPKAKTAPAAQPTVQQAEDADTPIIKVGVNEVDLVFTVTDKKGHFVTGLN